MTFLGSQRCSVAQEREERFRDCIGLEGTLGDVFKVSAVGVVLPRLTTMSYWVVTN